MFLYASVSTYDGYISVFVTLYVILSIDAFVTLKNDFTRSTHNCQGAEGARKNQSIIALYDFVELSLPAFAGFLYIFV